MAQSNRAAVEANKIPPEERFDFTVPRNGSRFFDVVLSEVDEDGVETPIDLTGQNIYGGVKTSYEAAHMAFLPVVTNRDDLNGAFRVTYPADRAKGLGIDVLDCVHDLMRAPSGGGDPIRIYAGLMELSKGVG
jgi:hypothetical protein